MTKQQNLLEKKKIHNTKKKENLIFYRSPLCTNYRNLLKSKLVSKTGNPFLFVCIFFLVFPSFVLVRFYQFHADMLLTLWYYTSLLAEGFGYRNSRAEAPFEFQSPHSLPNLFSSKSKHFKVSPVYSKKLFFFYYLKF